jgi:hypothetical protein
MQALSADRGNPSGMLIFSGTLHTDFCIRMKIGREERRSKALRVMHIELARLVNKV